MRDDILNAEDYRAILLNCFGDPDIEYVDSEISPLSQNVEGMLGDHYKLKIKYKLNGEVHIGKFFIKTRPTKTQLQKDMCETFRAYAKEMFLYNTLLKEFKEREYNVNFAPKCYLCKDLTTMVMEDLNRLKFSLSERKKLYSLSQCECLLKSLAVFHANGFMFEEEKSKELGRTYHLDEDYGDILKESFYSGNDFMLSYFDVIKKFCLYIIDNMKESSEFKEDFTRMLEEVDIEKKFTKCSKFKSTFGHGDLWSNNMMFLIRNDIATDCRLLDYQIIRYFTPAFDVMIALTENTNSTFRNKYKDYLIHYYYGCLSNELKCHGYSVENILPLNELLEAIKHVDVAAMYQGIGAHIFTFLPPSFLNNIDDETDNFFTDTMVGNNITNFVRSYNSLEDYRNMIDDDVMELYKSLKKLSLMTTHN